VDVPDRHIYCLDLRDFNSHTPYVEEVRRIAEECRQRHEAKQAAKPSMVQLGIMPKNGDSLKPVPQFSPEAIVQQPTARRWYPVIDYSRCTNCMECIDFCLFGVYGVDKVETILVEQPDNCRKGCPACSRVCPENAIIFPQHKAPEIAGSASLVASLKIDLSKLFGAPETGETAEQAAIRERDEQLLLAGRFAVGASVGLPKRQSDKKDEPKDELDSLLDALDNADV
jgi:NAD-dependent dihydropyrimidine dehydrogenase PreA subunit